MSDYIIFRVARQDFAMESALVRALLPMHDLQPLDPPAGWILGVANIRGIDFPVIDLRGKLGIPRGTHGRQPCIIAAQAASPHGPRIVGFVADRISEVITLRNHEILAGIVRAHGRRRKIFNPDVLLSENAAAADPIAS